MGLRRRTISAAFAGLALILGAVAFLLLEVQENAREDVIEQFESRAELSASLTASVLDQTTEERAEHARRLLSGRRPGRSALITYLRETGFQSSAGLLRDFRGVVLVASSPGAARGLRVAAGRGGVGRGGDRTYAGDVIEVDGELSIARVVSFFTPYGRRSVVDAEPLSDLDRFFKAYLSGASGVAEGQAFLIDSEGRLVASGGSLIPGRPIPDRHLARALDRHPEGSDVDEDGDRFVSVQVPRSDLRVVTVAPEEALFAALSRGLSGQIAWFLFGAFALAMIAGLILLLRVAERSRRLAVAERETRAQIEIAREREETERLKGEFFALVSHELRTPLTSILGYVQVMFEQEQLSERGRRSLDIVSRNADRLNGLVQDLLMVAQIEAGTFSIEPGEVDVAELASQCEQEHGPQAEAAGVHLSVRAQPLPAFTGDPRRLTQVLDNLVSNAIKFTPQGGHVEVSMGEENERCLIDVRDTGSGVSPDEVELLFNRFYRSPAADRDQVKGAGLGLAIAKAIVDSHGGDIGVENLAGGGSRFWVSLPMPPVKRRQEETESPLTA